MDTKPSTIREAEQELVDARKRFINADPLDVAEYDAAYKALQQAKSAAKRTK